MSGAALRAFVSLRALRSSRALSSLMSSLRRLRPGAAFGFGGAGAAGGAASASLPVRDQVHIGGDRPVRLFAFDRGLVAVALALLALGLVMVYSATVALPDNPKFKGYTATFFLARHLFALGLGFVAALVALQVPIKTWEKAAPWIFVAALVLLVAVLIPGIGKVVNNSRRWIPLGVMNFQPSELAKLAMAMYAASYMVRKMELKEDFVKAVWPMAVALGFTGALLLRQPDMGAFMVVAVISMGILFLGGVNGRMFLLSCAVLVATFVLVIVFSPEKRERIFAYLEPWDPAYAQGKAYQLTHSLIAFGRGEVFGQGLGDSVEKLHYLPEAHTDFLLAVIGEELGFVGVAVVTCCVWACTGRGARAAQANKDNASNRRLAGYLFRPKFGTIGSPCLRLTPPAGCLQACSGLINGRNRCC